MLNFVINPSAERDVLDLRALGFRDVLALGRYRYTRVRRPLAAHTHGKMFEICLLDRGRQTYVVGGRAYTLRGGDAFVTRPNEVHGTGGAPEERGVLYWLLLRAPSRGERFLGLPPSECAELMRQLQALPHRVFGSQGRLRPSLDQAFAAYRKIKDPLRTANIRAWLLRFLLDTVALGRESGPATPGWPVRRAMAHADLHFTEPLSVPDLARVARLSPSRFAARFKNEVGLSPADYVTRRRIEAAKDRLARSPAAVIAIAMDLGFSSSQYFASVFRKHTGLSPGEFRRKNRLGALKDLA
jgi:AraC-like DNA-binding protein